MHRVKTCKGINLNEADTAIPVGLHIYASGIKTIEGFPCFQRYTFAFFSVLTFHWSVFAKDLIVFLEFDRIRQIILAFNFHSSDCHNIISRTNQAHGDHPRQRAPRHGP